MMMPGSGDFTLPAPPLAGLVGAEVVALGAAVGVAVGAFEAGRVTRVISSSLFTNSTL